MVNPIPVPPEIKGNRVLARFLADLAAQSVLASGLPSTLTATYVPRVNAAGTTYELRSPAQMRSDIGADNASNLASGTVADARLPTAMAGKSMTTMSMTLPQRSVTTGIAAAGTTQGAATALTTDINVVATATGGANDSVRLMTAAAGYEITIRNVSGATINIFPATGAQINALGANNAITLATATTLRLYAVSATQWYS